MRTDNYESCRVSIFREIYNQAGWFEWYRMATQDELEATGSYIIVEETIPEDVLWERLMVD